MSLKKCPNPSWWTQGYANEKNLLETFQVNNMQQIRDYNKTFKNKCCQILTIFNYIYIILFSAKLKIKNTLLHL